MKTIRLKLLSGLFCLLAVLPPLRAQQTTLHDFSGTPDGANPGSVTLTNGVLYGATHNGGGTADGTLFSVTTNGLNYTILHDFAGNPSDGSNPNDVTVSGATVYGSTSFGGANNCGIAFKTSATANSGFTILHTFTNSPDGYLPEGGLTLGGITLYGTTSYGGTNGFGAVFKMTTNGANFVILHSFTNSPDGKNPVGTLVLNGATLYGVTTAGGTAGAGTVFKMNTNGSGFSIIHSFTNNPDGSSPMAGVIFVSNALYGTTEFGGNTNGGTIFRLGTNGANYSVLANFGPLSGNTNGTFPESSLFFTGGNLYGTANVGGLSNNGTLFELSTNGSSLGVLKTFTGSPDGDGPAGAVAVSGNTVYDFTYRGGSSGDGLALSLTLSAPTITQQPQSVSVANGQPASFTVAADGTGILDYQWRFNTNTPVTGATSPTLSFPIASNSLAGKYSVVITNNFGSVTSSFALLSIVNQSTLESFSFNTTNRSFSITVANAPQTTNRMWATTNLAIAGDWRVIATNVMASNGLWSFTDTNTAKTNAVRFYRSSTP